MRWIGFLNDQSLKVQISKKRFAGFINKGIIEKREFVFESKDSDKLIKTNYFIIKRKYSNELGLQMKEEEDSDILNEIEDAFL